MSALVCPRCERGDGLSTTERIFGSAPIGATITGDGSRDFDWWGKTQVSWDSSTTFGANCCYCDWSYEGDDWLDQLTVEPERCSLCSEAVEQRGTTLLHRSNGSAACPDPAPTEETAALAAHP